MLDVRRLRALRELADRGTIAAAADALHLTPSAVSQQLTALEREVGRPLTQRHGRNVRLTPAAHVVLAHADALFAEAERLEANLDALRRGTAGVVRVGSFPTGLAGIAVPAAVALRASHPGLEVEFTDVEAPDSFDLLGRHELDVVISMESSNAPQSGDARFARTNLMDDLLDAALPAGHPLATGPAFELSAMAEGTWVLPPVGWACEDVIRAACATSGFTAQARHRTSDWVAVLAMVEAGLGISLVPRLAQISPPRGVVIRPLAGDQPRRKLFAACRRGAEEHPAVQAVTGALVAAAREAETRRPTLAAVA